MLSQLPCMDGHLHFAIERALGRSPETVRDLKKIKVLDAFFSALTPFYDKLGILAPGDFSAIGEMENLYTLHFTVNRDAAPLQINDFSFLTQCRKLKRLDLGYTNFADCSLLLQLPALAYVRLPEKSRLLHLEVLDQLSGKVKAVFITPPESAAAAVSSGSPSAPKMPAGSETVKRIVQEIRSRTATDSYKLTVQPEKQPGLFDSKFGGLPYWDLRKPYPVDAAGEKLPLLAQINFDQFPAEDPLPGEGMLQFFAGRDDVFGINWDHPDQQLNFRVVYHESIDRSVTTEQVRALGVPTHADLEYWPVWQEVAVQMEKATMYMGPADGRFEEMFRQAAEAVGEDIRDQSFYQYLSREDRSYLFDQLCAAGHRLLGYPYFTQDDPRPVDSPFDTLLFQMDSDGEGKEDYTMWGDCGVANFFIPLENLKKRDFSRIFYTWDCC